MKAVIWKDIDKIEFTDVPEPECRAGWVKIKVMADKIKMITEPMKSIVFFMIKTSFFTIFSSI